MAQEPDNLEGLEIEEVDFQVVDECVDDEDVVAIEEVITIDQEEKITRNLSDRKMALEEGNKQSEDSGNQESTVASNNNEAEESTQDFTADVSFEQLDDRDVMDHLNEIENIVLDAESFGLQVDLDKSKLDDGQNEDDQDLILLEEEDVPEFTVLPTSSSKNNTNIQAEKGEEDIPEVSINKEKLSAKTEAVKNKFTKLARVLHKSYPLYKNWLERVAATSGTSICKLEDPRSCPPDRPSTNRWKFLCTRKPLEESAESKTEGVSAEVNVNNKNEKTVWRLGPSEGTIENTNNVFQSYPPYVMRAAKIFEEFINGIKPMENAESKSEEVSTTKDTDLQLIEEIKVEDDESKLEEDTNKEQWSWLLIRGNNKEELLIYAAGKEISSSTMENLKQLFETGDGKDCSVKSLYCKSVAMVNNATILTTTFLLGSEALEETVGGLKIQLPPKTNFPSSTVGVELLGKSVENLLSPNPKISVIEVGCGIGVICLMMASRCLKVIGLDSLAEIEEAEMTSELNKIKNASFVTGQPNELINTLRVSLRGCKTSAIINANTKIGRDIDVLLGLRTIHSIRRIAVITSMTKQSIRPIFELMKPADNVHGNPFMPIRAVLIDTQPNSPQFEVAILMERRPMHKILRPFVPISPAKSVESCSSQLSVQAITKPTVRSNVLSSVKVTGIPNVGSVKNKPGVPLKKGNNIIAAKKVPLFAKKGIENPVVKKFVKNPFHLKLDNRPKQTGKFVPKPSFRPGKSIYDMPPVRKRPQLPDHRSLPPKAPPKRRHENWDGIESVRGPVIPNKRPRPHENRSEPRSRPPADRNESNSMIETMKQHQRMLEEVIQELSGPEVDPNIAKHKMIEQMNQMKSQLSRSVWDRIAPPENPDSGNSNPDDSLLMKGSFVHDIEAADLVITTPNHGYLESCAPKEKYADVPPLEPNLVMPLDRYDLIGYRSLRYDNGKVSHKNDKWNRNQAYEKSHWRAQPSSSRRPSSPPRHHNRMSPKRPILSPPRRPMSPPRKHFSPLRHFSPPRSRDDIRRHMSPPRRPLSTSREPASPPRHLDPELSRNYGRRQNTPPRRIASPQRRPLSPPRRAITPIQIEDDWDIPSRGAVEQQSSWQRQDRQPSLTWDSGKQIDNFRKPIIQEPPNWEINKSRNDDNWNNQPPIQKKTIINKEQNWQTNVVENRWSGSGQSGPSTENWFMRNKEPFNKSNNSRDNSWSDNNKPRWEQQNFQKSWNPSNDKEDWNDLPEDARDPWGDDGGNGNKERWQNSEQGNWGRDKNDSVEWSGSNNGLQISTINTMWPNPNQNVNNQRWIGNFNDNIPKKLPQGGNWQHQAPSMNNSWRPNFPGGFQQQRPFNSFNDGR